MLRLLQCAAAFQSPLHKRHVPLSFHPSLTEYETAVASIDTDGGATSTATHPFIVETKANISKQTLPFDGGDQEAITLVPISRNPVILRTSAPILKSQEECDAVAAFFEYVAGGACSNANDKPNSSKPDTELVEYGAELFQFAQRTINDLVGGSDNDAESSLPRFLTYDPQDPPIGGLAPSRDELLPDGLHVDNNNGMHFRYMTVLFYLTSNNAGATTFPLAIPTSHEDNVMEGRDLTMTSTAATTATSTNAKEMEVLAQELIENGIYHTRGHSKLSDDEIEESSQAAIALDIIENAAVDLYQRQNPGGQRTSSHGRGVRVLPEAGYACVFLNLDESGCPDPLAFHGGENLLDVWGDGKQKKLLTFFREVPVQEFKTRNEFLERANERRDVILHRYFSQQWHEQQR